MKYFIKTIYFIILFGASLYFFGNAKDTWLSGGNAVTADASGGELPILSFEYGEYTVNKLMGYTVEQDPMLARDQFIVPDSEGVIQLVIKERGTDVRKMMFEIFDTTDGRQVADGQISAFDYDKDIKRARIKPSYQFEYGREYAVALTLITSESKRIYYYFHLKSYDAPAITEKLDYILNFSQQCRDKNHKYVIPYLESTYHGLSKSYAHVDIHDSYQMICWGNLTPTLASDIAIEINEIYKYIAVVTLRYTVTIDNASGHESYIVSEKFRVQLGTGYAYLLNYERDTEAVFDLSLMSLSQGQLKLGVTERTDVDILYSKDNSQLAFVRDNVLYYYNLPENHISTVYSGVLGISIPSEVSMDSGIKLLRMDDDGTISFMVYGYISSGTYEGKTGLVVYEYYHHLNRIQEVLYLPLAMTYDQLTCELGGFAYMNSNNVFFFQLHSHVYSYNLTTKVLTQESSAALSEDAIFLPGLSYAAWQQEGDMQTIHLLYLETGQRKQITVGDGEIIRLLSQIDSNLILGYGLESDKAFYSDGTPYYPVTHIRILDSGENVLKEYHKEGFYVIGLENSSTAIKLNRATKKGGSYQPADTEYILIKNIDESIAFEITTRVTDQMLTEYYLSLPSKYDFEKVPRADYAKVTVITHNTAVYLDELQPASNRFYVYSYGQLIDITNSVATALTKADSDDYVGIVLTGKGQVLWERGVMAKSSELLATTIEKAKEVYEKGLAGNTLSCTGAQLSQMLYYVYKNVPVYAMYDENTPILLTAYNNTTVTYMNLKTGKLITIGSGKLNQILESGGNPFMIAW